MTRSVAIEIMLTSEDVPAYVLLPDGARKDRLF